MEHSGRWISRLLWFVALVLLPATAAVAQTIDVRAVRVADHPTHTRLVVETTGKAFYRVTNLSGTNNTLVLEVFGVENATSTIGTPATTTRHAFGTEARHDAEKRWFAVRVQTHGPVRTEDQLIENPTRIVLDVYPQSRTAILGAQPAAPTPAPAPAGAWRRTIVIDPGHGGHHKGGWGMVNGRKVWEKDVVMQVALLVEQLLRADARFDVRLTRRADVYVGLRERTALASQMNGDLFISLHTNGVDGEAARCRARGFEIWTWNRQGSTSAAARAIEAIENADPGVSRQNNQILTAIMVDALEAHALNSQRLARAVHGSFMTDSNFRAHDRGIDQARFTVLEVYDMPSILVELGFLSHPEESRQLCDPASQRKMAKYLYDGIVRYFDQTDSTFPRANVAVAARRK